MNRRLAIPVLRCSAAGIPLGLAADEVAEFQPNADGDRVGAAPRLADLLGLLARPAPAGEGERTLRLRCGQGSALVTVEGPVHIRPVAGSDLLPTPRWLAGARLSPVIGFLGENGRVVVLLDVAGVVGLVSAAGAQGAGLTKGRQPC